MARLEGFSERCATNAEPASSRAHERGRRFRQPTSTGHGAFDCPILWRRSARQSGHAKMPWLRARRIRGPAAATGDDSSSRVGTPRHPRTSEAEAERALPLWTSTNTSGIATIATPKPSQAVPRRAAKGSRIVDYDGLCEMRRHLLLGLISHRKLPQPAGARRTHYDSVQSKPDRLDGEAGVAVSGSRARLLRSGELVPRFSRHRRDRASAAQGRARTGRRIVPAECVRHLFQIDIATMPNDRLPIAATNRHVWAVSGVPAQRQSCAFSRLRMSHEQASRTSSSHHRGHVRHGARLRKALR